MNITEVKADTPQQPDRITLVLRAKEGGTLKPILPFLKLGDQFSAEGFTAVIAGVSDEDLQEVLEQERELRGAETDLWQSALGMPALLAANAQAMYELLLRIETKCGGLNAVLGHGLEPSEQMWREADEAMGEIWPLMCQIRGEPCIPECLDGAGQAEQTTQNSGSSTPEKSSVVAESFSINDHVQMTSDASRHRYLRDRERIEDPDTDLLIVAGDTWLSGEELDREVDDAMRLARLEELQPCAN